MKTRWLASRCLRDTAGSKGRQSGGRRLLTVTGNQPSANQRAQFQTDAVEHLVPVARAGLPEQAHARIPGRVLTPHLIEPVGAVGKEVPYRPVHTASQMSHRTVGHDHQIQALQRRRRVAEVFQPGPQIMDQRAHARAVQLGLRLALLEAVQTDPWNLQKPEEKGQGC